MSLSDFLHNLRQLCIRYSATFELLQKKDILNIKIIMTDKRGFNKVIEVITTTDVLDIELKTVEKQMKYLNNSKNN